MDKPDYQRAFCTELCPRHKNSAAGCGLCKNLDEADRFWNAFVTKPLWGICQYLGVREICALANPNWKAATEPKPSTLAFWATGVLGAIASAYVAAFGLASTRFEARLDQIENRANGIYALTGSKAWKAALERIPIVQRMTLPEKPELLDPSSIFNSLAASPKPVMAELHKGLDVLEDLMGLIESFNRASQSFKNIELSKADLIGINLHDADFSGANLSRTSFLWADLSEADLREANLSGESLRGADFSGANLHGADLSGADLFGASFSEANFSEANLSGANLRRVDFSEADFSGANLREANLSGESLRGADFSGANLREANFIGVNLRKARGLTVEEFGITCMDETTKLPNYIDEKDLKKVRTLVCIVEGGWRYVRYQVR